MKHILFVLFLVFFNFSADAQQNWLTSYGGSTSDEVLDASVDQNGNLLMAGYFTGTNSFGSTILQSFGNSDILIIKTNPIGDLIWAVNAGGPNADRAISISTDNAGNSYITGYFNTSATFGSISITGQGRDAFVAKIDPSGAFLWATAMGGQFGDSGYGVEPDNLGNVFCTGQYKGNGVFGSASFSSTYDPISEQPSYDIFLSKLDENGDFLWTVDGKAKHDDRGLAITTDNLGNCYLAAEFSDTISFQNTYPNVSFNTGLILKFDGNGNEQWVSFARAGQVLLNDIKWKDNNLYLGGDYRGNLTFIDVSGATTYLSQHSYNVLAMKISDSGQLSWLSSNYSENELYIKQLTLDSNNDLYLAGLFKCSYDEMNALYGNSTFLSIGYRDVHYMKYSNTGEFQWARQIGSQKDDYCASIVINAIDFPILAGSFQNAMNVPSGSNFNYQPQQNLSSALINCDLGLVGGYASQSSNGYKDIFLSSPFDVNRLPYDFYDHQSNVCLTDTVSPCIENCADSIDFCYNPMGYTIGIDHFQIEHPLSPLYVYEWNNGANQVDTSFDQVQNTSQTFYVNYGREDGCYSWRDTLIVTINPLPSPPLITDSWGYNLNQPPSTTKIDSCVQDSLFIMATVDDLDDLLWDEPYTLINDSTVVTITTGLFSVTAQNSFGCLSTNLIEVVLDDFAIHDTLQPQIVFEEEELELTDSIATCQSITIITTILDSAFINPNGTTPYKYTVWELNGVVYDSIYHDYFSNQYGQTSGVTITDSGWYNISAHLVNECGDSVDYFIERDIYVSIVPLPQINLLQSSLVCTGDTVTLYATHYQDSITSWSGSNLIAIYEDSVDVVAVGLESEYSVQVDTFALGITCTNSDWVLISTPPQPEITMFPSNGIVCPQDSILLTALEGVSWQWIGPSGSIIGTNQNLHVNLNGFYHCIITLASGCILTSNFLETKDYSSPFLIVDPGVICSGDSTKIEVISPFGTGIVWQAPLSGNSFIQYVHSPGVYYCETSFCNITTMDSISVVESIPEVHLNFNGDTLICPVNEVLIFATPGFSSYHWNNGINYNFFSSSAVGYYFVEAIDNYGCTAVSDSIQILYLSNPDTPIVSDTTVCIDSDLTLTVIENDNLTWYQNNVVVQTGSTLEITNIQTETSYTLTNSDPFCVSDSSTFTISIHDTLIIPFIIGDTILCEATELIIITDSISTYITQIWTTPNGVADTSGIFIDSVNATHSGEYSIQFSNQFCTSEPLNFTITVNLLPIAEFSTLEDTLIICPLDTLLLTALTNSTSIIWSNQSTDSTQLLTTAGTYLYLAELNGCFNYSDSVIVITQDYLVYDPDLNQTICFGNSTVLQADPTYQIVWTDENLDTLSETNVLTTGFLFDTTTYTLTVSHIGFCPITTWSTVSVVESGFVPNYSINDSICVNDVINIETSIEYDTYSWIQTNTTISTQNIVSIPTVADGLLTVFLTTFVDGCNSDTIEIDVNVHPNPFFSLSTDTVFCIGQILDINSQSFDVSYEWYPHPDPQYDSLVVYTLTNDNGCTFSDSINIQYQNCDLVAPNVFTPNNDLVNDIFYFKLPDGEIEKITIFNRWGNLIHTSETGEWNGIKNDDSKAADGVYFYILEYTLFDNTSHIKQGYVTLIRDE